MVFVTEERERERENQAYESFRNVCEKIKRFSNPSIFHKPMLGKTLLCYIIKTCKLMYYMTRKVREKERRAGGVNSEKLE